MRFAIPKLGFAAACLALAWASPSAAQPFPAGTDTVDVAQGPPNTLFNAIQGDTTAAGARVNLNRVYRLARGARFINLTSLRGNFPIRVVAAKQGPGAITKPPIIQPGNAANGDYPETIANTGSDQYWEGVYFLGPTATGSTSFYALRQSGTGTIRLENVTAEYIQGILAQFDAPGGSFIARNSRFRNFQNLEQIYAGRVVYFTAPGTATVPSARNVIFENNTFSTIGGFIFQGTRGGTGVEVETFRFNHNTVYGVGLYAFLEEQWTDVQMLNNLFVNAVSYGERVPDRTGQDPDALLYGVFNLNTLRTGQTTSEFARRIGVFNNGNFRDPLFDAYYAGTPVGATTRVDGEPFFNSRTQTLFNIRASFATGGLVQGVNPGFTAPPTNTPSIITWLTEQRATPIPATRTPYAYDPDGSVNTITWPLPENLAYTNAGFLTAGTGGRPLGDLNWFPAAKAAWLAAGGAAADYADANTRINNEGTTRSAFTEAEATTITAGVSVKTSGDRGPSDAGASANQYLYMENSGTITWNFNVSTAGSYVLRIRHQIPFSEKAQLLKINGTAIPSNRPPSADFFFDGQIEVWKTVDIPVTLVAGANVFTIEKSFGYMYFDSFEILTPITAGEAGPDNAAFRVSNAFPNPTTGRTQVSVSLDAAAQVTVSVYDLLGRRVMLLPDVAMAAGDNQALVIDGSSLPGGTYVYRLEATQAGAMRTATGRMTVIR